MRAEGSENLERCRTAGDWREWRRLRAWQLRQQGWGQRDIAEALGATEGAVSRWVRRARQDGPVALFTSPSPGPARRLSDENCRALEELMAKGATAHG
jgi:transposase